MIYKNPRGTLRTPKNVLNGDPKYNLSLITSISQILKTFPPVECQLDNIVPLAFTFNIERRCLINV